MTESNSYRNPYLIGVQRIRVCGVLSPKWDIKTKLFLSRLRDHCGKRVWSSKEPQASDNCCEADLSRHDRVTALVNSVILTACTRPTTDGGGLGQEAGFL